MSTDPRTLCLAGHVVSSGATWCCNLPKGHTGLHDDGLGDQWACGPVEADPCPSLPLANQGVLADARPFIQMCGSCDAGLPMSCTCPPGDYRPVMARLVAEVERLRSDLGARDARVRAETLCKVDDRLAALPYRMVGGLPEVEREFMFDAVNRVARELFGDQWVRVMREAIASPSSSPVDAPSRPTGTPGPAGPCCVAASDSEGNAHSPGCLYLLGLAAGRTAAAADIRDEMATFCMDSVGRHLVDVAARIAEGTDTCATKETT